MPKEGTVTTFQVLFEQCLAGTDKNNKKLVRIANLWVKV
jgi:hypothetical protein